MGVDNWICPLPQTLITRRTYMRNERYAKNVIRQKADDLTDLLVRLIENDAPEGEIKLVEEQIRACENTLAMMPKDIHDKEK